MHCVNKRLPSCIFKAQTLVKPGKSTNVKLRTCGEYILRLIGCRLMPLLLPAMRAVSASISLLTSEKSYHFRPGTWLNSAHSCCPATLAGVCGIWISSSPGLSSLSLGTLMSCRIRGRRVTMPLPLGKKSLPTMFSRTEDFPEDCDPTTTWNLN